MAQNSVCEWENTVFLPLKMSTEYVKDLEHSLLCIKSMF